MKAAFNRTIIVAILWTVFLSVGNAIVPRPAHQRLVNDFAGIMTPGQASRLESILVAFDDSTSNQIAVVTVNDLEGYTASEYATRLGLDWQVGSEKFNNGIVVLVKPKTADSGGEVAISTGYGLEGAIPDAWCKRIIDNEMLPFFREGDYYSGISAACGTLMKLASGEISEPRPEDDSDDIAAAIFMLFFIFLIILLVIFMSKRGGNNGGGGNSGGKDDGDIIAKSIILGNLLGGSRGRSSWGGSSGGSFGGGSFGGGFGGFGGGSFGGGGASGKW